MNLPLLMTILITTAVAQVSRACIIPQGSDRVAAVIAFELCEQAQNTVFPNYRMSDYPFVLVDLEKSPNSITVIQKGKILGSFTVQSPLKIQNRLYEYQIPSDIHFDNNPELNPLLKSIGVAEAMIWNIGMDFPLTGSPWAGTAMETWPKIWIHLGLMTHEAFHLFGQHLQKISLAWPESYLGISDEAREGMQNICFNRDANTKSLVALERQAILDSFIAVKQKNLKFGIKKAKEFISTRKARYALLAGTQIPDPVLLPRSCEQVENAASVAEGIPEFIGNGTLLNLGIISAEQALLYFPDRDTGIYYRFSLFQALVFTSATDISIADVLQKPENGIEAVLERWIQLQDSNARN